MRTIALTALCVALLGIPGVVDAKIASPDDAIAATEVLYHRTRIEDINASVVAELPYMVAWWKGAGGKRFSSLLKKTKGNWTIVHIGTDALNDARMLERLGVPPGLAVKLVADLNVRGTTY